MPAVPTRPTDERHAVKHRILAALERRRQGKSYSEFAREVGIARPTLRLLELREYPPGIEVLSALTALGSEFEPLVLEYLRASARDRKRKIVA